MCLVVKIKICTLHGSYSFISLLLRDCWLQLPGLQRNVKKIKCLLPHWDPASSVLFCCISADAKFRIWLAWVNVPWFTEPKWSYYVMMKNDDWWRWYQRWMMNDEGWIWWMVVIHVSLWPAWRHLSQALIVALTVISLGRLERLGADHELQHETHSLRAFRFITYSWFISIHFDSFVVYDSVCHWSTFHEISTSHSLCNAAWYLDIISRKCKASCHCRPEKCQKSVTEKQNPICICVDGLGWSGMVWDGLKQCHFLLWIRHASF